MVFTVVSLVSFRGGADQWPLGPMVQWHQSVVSMWCLWWPVVFQKCIQFLSLSNCCVFSCLILVIIQKSVMLIAFDYACIFENINKLDSIMTAHWNTLGRVSQAQKRDYKRDEEIQNSCSIWGSSMDARGCTDKHWQFWCTCAVVFLLEDQSRWSWHHYVTSQGSFMLLREGTIKVEHDWASGLF